MISEAGKARQAALDDVISHRMAVCSQEQSELLAELANVGINVELVNYFRKDHPNYRNALPIFARHIHREYSLPTRQAIAAAMASKLAAPYWDQLVQLYRSISRESKDGASAFVERLAFAVSESMPPRRLDDYMKLLQDDELRYRVLLLERLRRRRHTNVKVRNLLQELRHHAEFSEEISRWKDFPSDYIERRWSQYLDTR